MGLKCVHRNGKSDSFLIQRKKLWTLINRLWTWITKIVDLVNHFSGAPLLHSSSNYDSCEMIVAGDS